MSKELQNKEIVNTYFKCLAEGDLERLGQLFAEDVIWHQPGRGALSKTYYGKQEVFALFGAFMTISQGSFRIDSVKSVMVNNDLVSAALQFSATKPGKRISMEGVDLMRIQEGKIKEVWLFSADQESEDAFWGV